MCKRLVPQRTYTYLTEMHFLPIPTPHSIQLELIKDGKVHDTSTLGLDWCDFHTYVHVLCYVGCFSPKYNGKNDLLALVITHWPTSRTPLKMTAMRGKRQPRRAAQTTPSSTRCQSGRLSASSSRNLIWSSSLTSSSSSSEPLLDRYNSCLKLLFPCFCFLPISTSTSSFSAVNCTVLVVSTLSGGIDERASLIRSVP